MKPGLFIQVRVDSSRLPGKALLVIQGKTTLERVIQNTSSPMWDTTVLTTSREVDDPIEAICLATSTKCFRWRGDPKDVLGRFYHGVRKTKLIIRVTADCLGTNRRVIEGTILKLRAQMTKYAYASPDKGYARGSGCEVFTGSLLTRAHLNATSGYDREHVTPWMQRNERGAEWSMPTHDDFDMELNTLEDYERIKNIYDLQM